MSSAEHHLDEAALLAARPTADLTRWRNIALGVGVVGIAASAIGAAGAMKGMGGSPATPSVSDQAIY